MSRGLSPLVISVLTDSGEFVVKCLTKLTGCIPIQDGPLFILYLMTDHLLADCAWGAWIIICVSCE